MMEIKHSSKSFAKKPSYPMHDRTKGVDANCKCKGVSKKAQQCLKKAFDVVPQ
jgi:hypothetical protein